jgi:hypothetical protein
MANSYFWPCQMFTVNLNCLWLHLQLTRRKIMDTLQAKIDHRLFTVLQSLHIKFPELHLKRWSNYMHAQTYGRTIEDFSVFNIHDEILVIDNESSKFCRRFSDNKKRSLSFAQKAILLVGSNTKVKVMVHFWNENFFSADWTTSRFVVIDKRIGTRQRLVRSLVCWR